MLAVQQYLQDLNRKGRADISHMASTEGALAQLKVEYGVANSQHGKHSKLYTLKYDQEASRDQRGSEIVRECRGLILDATLGTWKVVAYPFDRFFNDGEPLACRDINWHEAGVQEKVDGSLMILYYFAGEWHVATSGTPDAETPVPVQILGKAYDPDAGGAMTFKTLFWQTMGDTIGWEYLTRCLARLPRNRTYIFELCSPHNRVVVRYKQPKLYLLGCRYIPSGRIPTHATHEVRPGEMIHHFPGIDIPRMFPVGSAKEAFECLKEMAGDEQEGYVICSYERRVGSRSFDRIKMKCDDYLANHHKLDSTCSMRRVFQDLIFKGEADEFASVFDEHAEAIKGAQVAFDELALELEADFRVCYDAEADELNKAEHVSGSPNEERALKKAFALAAKDSRCTGALFARRNGSGIKDFLMYGYNIESLLKVLGYKG